MSIRISVVTQHRLYGSAIAALLKTRSDFRMAKLAVNADEVAQSAESKPPDVLLIDADVLSHEKGLLSRLADVLSGVPLIVLVSEGSQMGLASVLRSTGASVVLKDSKPDELYLAIRTVAEGGTYFSRAAAEQAGFFGADKTFAEEGRTLTARQRQILQLLAEGSSTKEIADRLSLSPRTIESHRSHIMQRLGIRHIAGLVRYAMRKGLIP